MVKTSANNPFRSFAINHVAQSYAIFLPIFHKFGVNRLSYVVSIRRDVAISGNELQAAVENDPELTIAVSDVDLVDDVVEIEWRPEKDAEPEYFVLFKGVVDVTSPSNGALMKIQSLAVTLEAQVFGEEGEVLTDVKVTDTAPIGCGPAAWTVLLFSMLLFAYWWVS